MKTDSLATFALLIASVVATGAVVESARAEDANNPGLRSKYVRVEGLANPIEAEEECDAILRRLFQRYGVPQRWRQFPVRFSNRPGGAIAGYTSYVYPNVTETVIFQSFAEARGGTLDHELTHAFFFYFLDSHFDLFFNEGVAQNSEYAKRGELRVEVARRCAANEFARLRTLCGRGEYDARLNLYVQGFSVVDYLIGRAGSLWFAAFLQALAPDASNVDAALDDFYGIAGLEALEAEWLVYVCGGQDRESTRAVK